jgi:hypothetical protein
MKGEVMRARKLALVCLVALLAGCLQVVSLQPLFTEENVVFDEKLLGTWLYDPNKPEATWEFSRLDEATARNLPEAWRDESTKFYHLKTVEKNGGRGSFVACLVKLGDRLFLDVFPDRFPSGEQDMKGMKLAHNAELFLPVHTFIKVDSIGEQLVVRATLDNLFRELVQAEPNAVEHQIVDGHAVLTASTKELQEFVTKFADDERLFVGPIPLQRKRPSAQ